MKMNRIAVAVGLIASCYFGSALAVGPVGPSNLGDLTGKSISIGNNFAPASPFTDTYYFDISSLSAVVGTTVTITLDIPQLQGTEFQISSMMIDLKDSSNNDIAYDNTLDSSNALQISTSLVNGTGYKFIVSGTATGTLGGSYGGVLAAVAEPVPEAEVWSMLLAGLGLVALRLRSRDAAARRIYS